MIVEVGLRDRSDFILLLEVEVERKLLIRASQVCDCAWRLPEQRAEAACHTLVEASEWSGGIDFQDDGGDTEGMG